MNGNSACAGYFWFLFRLFIHQNTKAPIIAKPAKTPPTLTPAVAPVERPELADEVG